MTWRSCAPSAQWLMARESVHVSYETVAADLADRAERNCPDTTPVQRARAAASTAAVIFHRRNRARYLTVMALGRVV